MLFRSVPDHAQGVIPEGGLAKRVEWVRSMDWGGSTDVDAVFDMLLAMCVEHQLTAEAVSSLTVCVFSDMQFNQARGDGAAPWETAHEAIVRKWRDAGYASAPTIVYWNLRDSLGAPADEQCPGVVMLSGFSSSLLEAFLSGRIEDLTPIAQMRALLSKECYARLKLA